MSKANDISVGKVSGVFGIKGWVKVFSYTESRENILSYSPWLLKKGSATKVLKVVDGNYQGKLLTAQLESVNDRDQAAALMGWDIFIKAEQLPKPRQGEYYWSDLIGLKVITNLGVEFGVIDSLLETGAYDVVIVNGERERVIPFLQGETILSIDLDLGIMTVDWDPDF